MKTKCGNWHISSEQEKLFMDDYPSDVDEFYRKGEIGLARYIVDDHDMYDSDHEVVVLENEHAEYKYEILWYLYMSDLQRYMNEFSGI
jgi:hypothetical protein